ncbi:tumor necrosis factor receptor superfamily member 14-like isoform X26 [Dicentrarchus labrax]|uniref:tumor necrosis factor receptor superfamily member 14-like isoform X26 n=1 Tax=Dicentrarchus labrax TaxID=13489 RepID=UPI0021F58115|nr:tumor necrosis factor receptor superfamily member 14-like isoform X26 [Dicentrarchus labrax]
MMFGRKPLTAAPLLIVVMNIFRGHALPCHPSEYQRGNECCPKCLHGSRVKTDCTEFRSTSCLSCTEGTFMNHPTGRTQSYSCTICDAGSGLKIKTSCTITSDTVCEPLEGFYCLDSAEDGCMSAQRHTLCQPGQYIRQKGTALTDTECSDCSAGTYSDGTFPSCQSHTQCESMNLQLIKAGTVSTDAQCGEQSSNPTGIVIGVVIVGAVIFLLIGAALFVLYHCRRKKGCLNTGMNADISTLVPDKQHAKECDVERTETCNVTHHSHEENRKDYISF